MKPDRTLDLRSRNQKLIVSNLANLDTPNYKAFKMMIDEQMGRASGGDSQVALKTTRQGHIVPGRTRVETTKVDRVEHNPHSIRGDGNTVELEREMSNLAENTLMYNTATRLVANKFNLLKSVIKGGS